MFVKLSLRPQKMRQKNYFTEANKRWKYKLSFKLIIKHKRSEQGKYSLHHSGVARTENEIFMHNYYECSWNSAIAALHHASTTYHQHFFLTHLTNKGSNDYFYVDYNNIILKVDS